MTGEAAGLHVTFGHSAAGSLKKALATLRIAEDVAALADDYSMGPIDPGDADQRADWEREELGEDDPIAISDVVTSFWQNVSTWPGQVVVELSGLHELLWRVPGANIHVVDVASVDFRRDDVSTYDERHAFAIVRDERIVELSLIDAARPVSDVERASYRRAWGRLRTENAALRVLTTSGLVSAPVDYFDDRIRALITDDWQRCTRIVGAMIGFGSSGTQRESHSDTFFFVRLLHLIDQDDEIEAKNDNGPDALWSMHDSWIRRRGRG
jgi:hypothetical protein